MARSAADWGEPPGGCPHSAGGSPEAAAALTFSLGAFCPAVSEEDYLGPRPDQAPKEPRPGRSNREYVSEKNM